VKKEAVLPEAGEASPMDFQKSMDKSLAVLAYFPGKV
jgi:hypothetical protein